MRFAFIAALACLFVVSNVARATAQQQSCARVVEADIVAIDQPIFLNRLGASMPGGMIYALRRDVVAGSNGPDIAAGNARLNPDRRPRPLVLRVRVGDCLHVRFQNLLSPTALPSNRNAAAALPAKASCPSKPAHGQPACIYSAWKKTVANGTLRDGSFVGTNPSSLVPPSGQIDYIVRAPAEGVFLMYSTAANATDRQIGRRTGRSAFRRPVRQRRSGTGHIGMVSQPGHQG